MMMETVVPTTSVHTWLSLCAFFITIILVITSPRIPVMFNLYKWYRARHQQQSYKQHVTEEDIVAEEEGIETQLKDETVIHETVPTTTASEEQHNTQQQIPIFEEQQQVKWYHKYTKHIASEYLIFVTLDIGLAPLLSLLVLLCTRTLSLSILKKGIVGNEYLQPYSIVILFMSLAYVCISLDLTLLFQYLAQLIVQRSRDSGKKLFLWFSIFTSVLTIVTSNDIVILTVTPILCYTARQTKNLDPIPFVTTQFFLANVWSITLKIGNPTNVIVAEAYNLSFLNYFLWMAIPAAVAGLSTFGISYLIFRKRIPDVIELTHDPEATETEIQNDSTSRKVPLDKKMAVTKSILLLLCLASLATVTNIPRVKTWMICFGFGILFLAIDVISDIVAIVQMGSVRQWWEQKSSITIQVITRMPHKIVPFVFSMFIIVELLAKYRLVSMFAQVTCKAIIYLTKFASPAADGHLTTLQKLNSVSVIVFTITILSFLMCNVMNNQPMTILFTTLLHDDAFQKLFATSPKSVEQGAMLSLVIGSNLGANFTLIGALAGLLWIGILRDLGTKGVSSLTFTKYAVGVTPLVILLVCVTLIAELMIAG